MFSGCAHRGSDSPNDEELTLQLLRNYESAIAAYDAKAAKALLADDYVGFRNSGKEGIDRLIGWMQGNSSVLQLDLTQAVVAVDGDTARVSEVGNQMGQRNSTVTYVLTRASDGWKIQTVER
jgi:ketosteroid isomerase-like protein